jgi:hypothetical protein
MSSSFIPEKYKTKITAYTVCPNVRIHFLQLSYQLITDDSVPNYNWLGLERRKSYSTMLFQALWP